MKRMALAVGERSITTTSKRSAARSSTPDAGLSDLDRSIRTLKRLNAKYVASSSGESSR